MNQCKPMSAPILKIVRFGVLTCGAILSLNSALADQVILKNGDRVTGSIVKKDGKTLTIKTDNFGVVTTSWDQVESIRADKPVHVVLQSGKTVQGTLSTENGKIEVAAKAEQLSVAPTEITTIRNAEEQHAYERLLNPGWTQLWAGSANIGWAGTAGNAKTLTFTTGLHAARVTNTDKTSVYFETIKASALVNGKNSDTAQAVRGGVGYDHNVSSRVFINTFNDYEYDKFQNLDLRFVLGGGLGYHVIKGERATLDLMGGIDFNRSSYSTPLVQKFAEAYWGNAATYKLNANTSFIQSFRMFDDLTAGSNYRINFDVGAATKIAKWLVWNVSASDRYLNHPAPGRKTNDLLYTTGVGFTFAR